MPRTTRTTRVLDPTRLANSHYVRYPVPSSFFIQGKQRHPNSRAAKHFLEREKERIRKALDYLTHGKDIFAFSNIRTKQVIYSFSRFLYKTDVLSQLIYHGKKTVPSTRRRDMWVPYFSVHFSDAEPGLRVFKLLREFSTRRQLEPPKEMITHTNETLDRKRPNDPNEAKDWDKKWRHRVGQVMGKKDRARQLMDQKATSVADLAFVLGLQRKEAAERQEDEELRATLERKAKEKSATSQEQQRLGQLRKQESAAKQTGANLSIKAKKRQSTAQRQAKAREKEIYERIRQLERQIQQRTGLPVKIRDERRIAQRQLQKGEVVVLWKDLQDSLNAQSWPEHVVHHKTVSTAHSHMSPTVDKKERRRKTGEEQESEATEESGSPSDQTSDRNVSTN